MGQSGVAATVRKFAATLALLTIAIAADAAEITDRMSLVEAIESLTTQGIEIAYSSQLVKPWMRVRNTPLGSEPLAALREVLAVYGLALNEAAENRWLIVRGAPRTTVAIESTGGVEQDIEPQPVTLPPLEEVMIVASRHSLFDRQDSGDQFLTGDEIRLLPHIADDAFRAFHRLPGAAADDFSAPFHLRGGTVDEVKVVLDGLEIFEPFHLRTLFSPLSIIDPGVIGQAQVFSGGFAADFGNHMSGVIDISSDLPDTRPVHELGVSFVSSFARSSGIFASGRGNYQISGRRGYLDLIADQKEDKGEQLVPRYNDVFARASYTLNDTVDVTAQVLLASDKVRFSQPSEGREVDDRSSLDHVWVAIDLEPTDSLILRNVLFTGRVESMEDGRSSNPPAETLTRLYSRNVEISGLQSDLDLRVNARKMWKIGARYRKLEADYDYFIDSVRHMYVGSFDVQSTVQRNIVASRQGDEFGVFVDYRFQPSSRTVLELGLRWDKQTYTDTEERQQLSPRLSGLFRLGDRTDLRIGWGHYYQPQGIQNLQVEDGVEEYFPAERAEHLVAGIRHRFESGMELQADLYSKNYSDIHPRFENALDTYEFAPESTFDRVRIEPDSAESRGVELTLRNRQANGFDWWLNYTWSKAEDEINGAMVPRSWDQRQAFTANLAWRGDRWSLSAVGGYHSGRPRTNLLVSPILDDAGDAVGIDTDLSQRNSGRYDGYSRVDIRLSRDVDLPHSYFQFYFEIFNLFNTTNECCVPGHKFEPGSSVVASPVYDDYLPLFPSFGFVWTFGPGISSGPS
jgi:hypothetical protein